jgi:hypothetical protein
MEDMYRLDFGRGTVEKIDSSIPPRGWHEPSPQPHDTPPAQRQGHPRGAPAAPADADKE